MRRHDDFSRRHRTRHRELHPNREDAFEHRERLIDAELLEIDRGGEDDLGDRHAFRRIDGEDRRDEVGVAWLVRLNVEALGQRDLERRANRLAGGGAVALDERREGGGYAADLGTGVSRMTAVPSDTTETKDLRMVALGFKLPAPGLSLVAG